MTHGDVKGSRTLVMITADRGRGTHSSSMRRTLRTGAELPPSTYAVQSLERAASLLRSFSAAEPELTIGDLARRSNLPRSTVHRLVVNLMRLGFLAGFGLGALPPGVAARRAWHHRVESHGPAREGATNYGAPGRAKRR